MVSEVEVQHLAPAMFQHDEHEQHFHGDRRHGEKVHRHRLPEVIVKKGLPRLSGWTAERPDDPRHRALRNRNSEHLEFAVNSRGTPQRIGGQHSFDQAADLGGRRGPASTTAMRFR